MTISLLDHRDATMAEKIHGVLQRSYRKEAEWIGVEDFPPLSRTAADVKATDARFFGCWEGESLAAVTEITRQGACLSIDSLVVDPAFFRRGLASRLLDFVLDSTGWETSVVETAVANEPAIALYRKLGFVEVKRWVPSHGIPKLMLLLDSSGWRR